MTPAEARLDQLVKRLEAERGMASKVRLLARSWPLLRELSPRERERVALAVGSGWASRNLEGMFGPPGGQSENQRQVKAIFERMRDADPNELRRLGKEMKRTGVSQAKSRLLGALEEALDEQLAADDKAQPPEAAPAESSEARTGFGKPSETSGRPPVWLPPKLLEELAETDPDKAPEPSDASAISAQAEAKKPLAAKPESAELELERDVQGPPEAGLASSRGASAASQETTSSGPPVLPRDPNRSQPRLEATSQGTDPGSLAAGRGKIFEARRGVESEPEPSESGTVMARLDEEPSGHRSRDVETLSAIQTLRALRQLSAGAVPGRGRAGRAALVASLGSGWAARRAVSSMIRSRFAGDLEEALDLIRRLPGATQRTWCLGDLLQHWQLDAEERERVFNAAPTQTAKRRLARRAAQVR